MLGFELKLKPGSPLNVLCLGAHSDDLEIGCGGTILRLIKETPNLSVYWVIFGAHGKRAEEAINSARSFLSGIENQTIVIKDFRDSFFPYIGGEIKEYFEQLKQEISPDLIFTHFRQDLHQDHRLICELTWNTFREHLILEYEVPKYDGDLGSPNLFVALDEVTLRRKINLILKHFITQEERHWFSEETFLALMRLRGIESKSPSKYAEAFYCRKIIVQL